MTESRVGPVGIVGPGRLGSALARALIACGYRVDKVAGRSGAREAAVAASTGASAVAVAEVVATCDLVILAVPDAAIEGVAGAGAWRPGQSVVHCGGAASLEVLETARERGALVGCLHPLQSFSGDDPPERFHGITMGIEAAEPLGGWLEGIARDLGGRVLRLEGVDRARYHAAAVLASNDVVALMSAAARTWEAAGLPIDTAREALAPLLLGAARNIESRPLADALTGPVARGDVATVRRHLEALALHPDLRALYSALARELLGLPLALDGEARAQLERLLAPQETP